LNVATIPAALAPLADSISSLVRQIVASCRSEKPNCLAGAASAVVTSPAADGAQLLFHLDDLASWSRNQGSMCVSS
jgi:hypothetical protein